MIDLGDRSGLQMDRRLTFHSLNPLAGSQSQAPLPSLLVVAALVLAVTLSLPVSTTSVALATDGPTPGRMVASDTLHVRTVLAIPAVGRGGRVPFIVDPIEEALIRGGWESPSEGDTVVSKAPSTSGIDPAEASTPTVTWKRFSANEDGWIESRELAGGYAVASIDVPEAGIYLLDGAGYRHVYVNGVPRIGDVYHRGFLRIPVELRKGTNELIFKEGWGAIRASLYPSPSPIFLEERDLTLPSVLIGETDATAHAGVVVSNASREWRHDLYVVSRNPNGEEFVSPVGSLPPLRTRKVAVGVVSPFPARSSRVGSSQGSASLDGASPVGSSLDGASTEGASPDGAPPDGASPDGASPSGSFVVDGGSFPDSVVIELELRSPGNPSETLSRLALQLDVRRPEEKHFRSFVSHIDGSVQHYGVTPPPEPVLADSSYGLYLTLHGAGVPARQAHHYRQRPDAFIVSPTNRREFGFDWEDWGRLDALEVLQDIERVFPLNEQRRWLTGHSMGGHGTWNFGAHYPDLFGAIGPSAGWRDFWSYTAQPPEESHELSATQEILSRSANGSRTLLLEDNYRHSAVYILHGDADATVPVEQARFMRERLGRFHPNFAYYEQPGAGHWWGDECMDWPPLMEFLERNPLPESKDVTEIDFTTINPSLSDKCFWIQVEGQQRWMSPSRVEAHRLLAPSDSSSTDPDTIRITLETENVSRLSIEVPSSFHNGRVEILADSQSVRCDFPVAEGSASQSAFGFASGATSPVVGSSKLHLAHDGASWVQTGSSNANEKGPHRSGPFKAAFQNRVLFVVGTGGTPDVNKALLDKALFDAETFYYRGNGAFEVILDLEFDAERESGRNVILYGNANNNGAWYQVLRDCPIRVERDRIVVESADGAIRSFDGPDLACLFTYPRFGDTRSSVGVVAGTGLLGLQTCRQLPYFVSGTGYPDWTVFGSDVLQHGDAGVRAAGFFDATWSVGNDSAYR